MASSQIAQPPVYTMPNGNASPEGNESDAFKATMSASSGGNSSDAGRSSDGSNNSACARGILKNAHEAPKKTAKPAESGFRSALKAAFIQPQPGKQMKTKGQPLGKSFERTKPLPVKHEGGEVLSHDPRGEHASCGDGIILSPTDTGSGGDEGDCGSGGPSTESFSEVSQPPNQLKPSSDDGALDSKDNADIRRGRSETMSSTTSGAGRSPSMSGASNSGASTSGSSVSNTHCCIKFAPLPTSGRLKRANSITIGVAARSQLLHSQGSGRATNNLAQQWQSQFDAQQQRRSAPESDKLAHTSGIQPPQRGRAQEHIDLGEEFKKGAAKAWNRVRRGSSVSSASSSTTDDGRKEAASKIESVHEEEDEQQHAEAVSGEKTPKRSHSPSRMSSTANAANASHEEPEGARTPRTGMQRRVSTGTFIGAQSFREMEEKRKRSNRGEEVVDGDNAQGHAGSSSAETDKTNFERELGARFAEKLGRTGASRELHHTGKERWHPGMRVLPDGKGKDTEIVAAEGDAHVGGDSIEPDSLEEDTQGAGNDDDNVGDSDDDADDEEAQEAQRLADEALSGHSAQATKAGGVEKMEKKKSGLARLVGA